MFDLPLPLGPKTTEKSWKYPISFLPKNDLKFSRIILCNFKLGDSL